MYATILVTHLTSPLTLTVVGCIKVSACMQASGIWWERERERERVVCMLQMACLDLACLLAEKPCMLLNVCVCVHIVHCHRLHCWRGKGFLSLLSLSLISCFHRPSIDACMLALSLSILSLFPLNQLLLCTSFLPFMHWFPSSSDPSSYPHPPIFSARTREATFLLPFLFLKIKGIASSLHLSISRHVVQRELAIVLYSRCSHIWYIFPQTILSSLELTVIIWFPPWD